MQVQEAYLRRCGCVSLVVVNEYLMDNHQSELAEELAERKHLFCASPQTISRTIKTMHLGDLIPYHPGDARPVAKLISRFLGFLDD
ncbi:N-acetylglucosaminyldiphosphodolichol N-acetylglucosaminyltransferase [Sarracenia purpurea var. burkii]